MDRPALQSGNISLCSPVRPNLKRRNDMNPIFESGIEGVMCAESVRWGACLENVAPRHTQGLWLLFLQDIARLLGHTFEQSDFRMWQAAIGDLTPPNSRRDSGGRSVTAKPCPRLRRSGSRPSSAFGTPFEGGPHRSACG